MIDILYNIKGKTDSIEVTNLMVTSTAGQRLVITENKEGEFNIKVE